jgi:hypothetical protein
MITNYKINNNNIYKNKLNKIYYSKEERKIKSKLIIQI